MTNFIQVKNNSESTLAGGINAVVLALNVVDDTQFPVVIPFRLTIDSEIVEVTAIDGVDPTLYTITRGVEGTTPAGHALGADVLLNVTAGAITELQNNLDYMSRRNAIINGCGIVNQRVTAYTLAKDVYNWDVTSLTGPDMFEGMATGTAVTAGTYNNTAAANCGVSGYAFKFIAVTLTGAGEIHHRYRMEAKDAMRFKNQTASFRCQVYQDTGGAINYTIYVRKANAADNFSAVTAISDSGAISVPNATATSLPYLAIAMGDCSNGIEIEVVASAGAITTKNFEFTEYQLEPGSVATPFEFKLPGQELSLCMAYCEKNFSHATAPVDGAAYTTMPFFLAQGTGAGLSFVSPFLVAKRTIPTMNYFRSDLNANPGKYAYEVIGAAWYETGTVAGNIITENFISCGAADDGVHHPAAYGTYKGFGGWLATCPL